MYIAQNELEATYAVDRASGVYVALCPTVVCAGTIAHAAPPNAAVAVPGTTPLPAHHDDSAQGRAADTDRTHHSYRRDYPAVLSQRASYMVTSLQQRDAAAQEVAYTV